MLKHVVKLVLVVCLLCGAATASGADFASVDAATLNGWLSAKKPIVLADIQKSNAFLKHHFYGSVETDAYPVKTASEKSKLTVILRKFQETGNDIVIIGPRGSSAAKRAAKYLIDKKVPAEKVFILQGGIKDWPDQEMLLDVAGGCA